MKLKYLLSLLIVAVVSGFVACSDDNDDQDVGASVQPAGDLLTTYSNKVDVTTSSVLVDSVLSKNDYLYLGQYSDPRLGAVQCEYMSQFDARLDGISLPDLTLIDSAQMVNKTKNGIYAGLLRQIDKNFGDITEITDASGLKVDSAFFLIRFDNDIMGDSMALQAIDIYALSGVLPAYSKHYSNVKVADYCDKKKLLGSLAYQVAGKYSQKYGDALEKPRMLEVPFDVDYANEIAKVYLKNSGIKYQKQFNEKFPGVYVAHSFNEGAVIKIITSYVLIYYHFEGKIHTTYNGKDTIVDSRKLGNHNPLQRSLTLACNKSVERVNLFNHPDKDLLQDMLKVKDFTYVTSPAGIYTKVDINFDAVRDSIVEKAGYDSSKISVNSATLRVNARPLNWASSYQKTPNHYMLLIDKDSIESFFYSNKTPDGVSSMRAVADTSNVYSFDLARAVQLRLKNPVKNKHLLENMVMIPIIITSSSESGTYFYQQQFWPSATRIYSSDSNVDAKLRPSIDLIFTKRE